MAGRETILPVRLGRCLMAWLLGMPVFVKVLGISLGMAVVLGAGMFWQINQTWRRLLLRDLDQRGQAFADEIAIQSSELVQSGRSRDLADQLAHSVAESPDVTRVVVRERNGTVLAEVRGQDASRTGSGTRTFSAAFTKGFHVAQVEMSTGRAEYEVRWLTGRLARTMSIIGLLGVLASWGWARLVSRPIEELAELARAVKAGNYAVEAPVLAKGEVGELAQAFNEMTAAVAHKESVRQQLLRQIISASEEERKRIARELHDHTGQLLTSQIAVLSVLESQAQDDRNRSRIAEVRGLAEQMLDGIHHLSLALRPSVLDDLGLLPALERHCRSFGQRFNLGVTCRGLGLENGRLPPDMELVIYRVVQESLTNAVRHGQATKVRVLVQKTDTAALVTVKDNGQGFDSERWREASAAGGRLGLLGIEERVTLLKGSFCVDSRPGHGATVYTEIPLPTPSCVPFEY
ncbi:MAG: ATP-binding protein [Verrucomicrobiia bacterium]